MRHWSARANQETRSVMGTETGIAWTDHTFNPWWGCTKVSPGCDHCYAESFDKRVGGAHWGKGQPRRVFGEKHWAEPLKWNYDAEIAGVPAKVFCASMADVMDDESPEGQLQRLWALIDQTPYLLWQLLTKRPSRYATNFPVRFRYPNVVLGTTAENQHFYDIRWPILDDISSRRGMPSFISYEPALGPLTMRGFANKPDWIIFGGETGSGRRPMERAWADNLLAECLEYGVAFFMKQMSAATPKRAAALIPAELLIRQFPDVRS